MIPGATEVPRYEVEVAHQGRVNRTRDPYTFLPTLGELDLHLFGEGRHHELWERLGAHLTRWTARRGRRSRCGRRRRAR